MNDTDQIREQLQKWVMRTMPHNPGDVFVNELCFVDKARRADLVHANGKLTGFEIKSSADTLSRWSGQQESYLLCFDEVWLCCHSKHIEKALQSTEKSVGLLVVDDHLQIAQIRKAKPHKFRDSYVLSGLLWRDELNSMCAKHNIPTKSSLKIKEVRLSVSEALDWETIRNEVLKRLKLRYSTKSNHQNPNHHLQLPS